MEKIITARFDSVDAATFAARRVTSHFKGIRSVKVSYKDIRKEDMAAPGMFLGMFAPLPLSGGTFTNSMFSEPAMVTAVSESDEKDRPQPARVTVRVTASAQDATAIAATLRFGGGLDVKADDSNPAGKA